MATKKTIETANDKKDKISIIEIIQDIDSRLTHLEDMQMDNRDLIVKLVKQGNRTEALKDIIDDMLERHSDLKEFEDELKKHKDKITPGQVGES